MIGWDSVYVLLPLLSPGRASASKTHMILFGQGIELKGEGLLVSDHLLLLHAQGGNDTVSVTGPLDE